MGVRQLSAGHKPLPPNHFYRPANRTILTCVIQHCCHPFTIIHTLSLCHLLFHEPHQLLPLTCQLSTSYHQVLHILHFSTFPLLHNLFSLLTCRHLPISTSNLAVPLLKVARILLFHFHFTSTHLALYSFSVNILTSTICWILSMHCICDHFQLTGDLCVSTLLVETLLHYLKG